MTGAQTRFIGLAQSVIVYEPHRELLAVVEQAATARRRMDDLVLQVAAEQQRWRDLAKQAQDNQKRIQAAYAGLAASAMQGIPIVLPARHSEPKAKSAQPTPRSDVRIMLGLMGQGRAA